MVYETKKGFLKSTVDNLIVEIDAKRKRKARYVEKFVNQMTMTIQAELSAGEKDSVDFITRFSRENPDCNFVAVLLWDNKKEQALYDPKNVAESSWEKTIQTAPAKFLCYRVILNGSETILLGVDKEYADNLVKEEIADTIRTAKFGDESYMWVNEIVDYEGGDRYAIRRVHPNLPETEGTYLSTATKDVVGNLPYLEELEGVKKDGELFSTYYFKELHSQKISEKVTYAKLYKDYDWVIAMGVYLEDLQVAVDKTNQQSKALASKLTLVLLVLFVGILALSYAMILLTEKLHYLHSKKLLESEMNRDTLTKAGNRRSGKTDLVHAFSEYQKNGRSFGIVMLDIDLFKNVNDQYGHAAGDCVLVELVKAMKEVLSHSDRVIRWGGDEFVLIFSDANEGDSIALCEEILLVASSLKIVLQNEKIEITLSMGLSFFIAEDDDFTGALRRADKALYQSKTKGRNQVSIMK